MQIYTRTYQVTYATSPVYISAHVDEFDDCWKAFAAAVAAAASEVCVYSCTYMGARSYRPNIVKIRAILAIFRPFEVLGCQKSRIFERPFTPRGWLRSASNFGKTRFRRSPTFHLSTSKKNFGKKI